MADILSSLTNAFSNPSPDNYYAQKAAEIYAPARIALTSSIAGQQQEGEQQAIQRNQINGMTGPIAEQNIERNNRLIGEAGGRTLNALDEQGRQAVYGAAEKDRQEYMAKAAAQQQGIFDTIKMGAGLIAGGGKGIYNLLGGFGADNAASDFADKYSEDLTGEEIPAPIE